MLRERWRTEVIKFANVKIPENMGIIKGISEALDSYQAIHMCWFLSFYNFINSVHGDCLASCC